MKKKWWSLVYGFYKAELKIGCKQTIIRYLDTTDAQSTSNMQKHTLKCWGDEAVKKVASGINHSGKITMLFEQKGKGKVFYSHTQHSKPETRVEIIHWVAKNLHPFSIVANKGFQTLMKTGQPGYYLPSPSTVSCDVKVVFAKVWN
ncbi:hypothetical protein BDN71DRAFT_1485355 [Pleurotus eryngii]|uniref:Uncharacterized protein n=1 Tax=Pleurotus eryngii TaxID=5323 RepID=A0A9P5ZHM4_PLEER|nr:hypothetical protein BDN71DRAFT_1485355 [Pleurotus eryngii]